MVSIRKFLKEFVNYWKEKRMLYYFIYLEENKFLKNLFRDLKEGIEKYLIFRV